MVAVLLATGSIAQQRFPPPDFENGYQIPATSTPATRAEIFQYLDIGVLAACLGVALWFIYARRSRRGLFWLSLFSLGYFGFYRKGCICPIGSPQNIIYGLCNPGYSVPLAVIAFFLLPLFVALLAGRAFCAGVCPQGALQDFFLVKPVKVPSWLEHGLGILPFVFLGAGLAYAATGTGFIICRYDPFVPIFRLSGSIFILTAGAAFLLISMFVGRAYCRFLCPYGALLKLASGVSKWRVRVTPDFCTQCRLCEASCPFGSMREPSGNAAAPVTLIERARLGWLLALLPILIIAGTWAGMHLSSAAAQLDPKIVLAERYVLQKNAPVQYGAMTPDTLALSRAGQNPQAVVSVAANLGHRFKLASALFGGWLGLVLGVKLISLSLRESRTDYEPDNGACFACARCFASCPNELTRIGAATIGTPSLASAAVVTGGGR